MIYQLKESGMVDVQVLELVSLGSLGSDSMEEGVVSGSCCDFAMALFCSCLRLRIQLLMADTHNFHSWPVSSRS
jgi:hypothetical protein